MAHYKNGAAAHIGDIARGRGYNLPYDVQGVVVGLTPGSESCNIHLAVLRAAVPVGTMPGTAMATPYPTIYEEHGTCGEFELVHPSPTRPLPIRS